ncbi:hypothetical protein [Streptomyces sp. NBC_00989]|uniref:hypothetical protein n=1 Tax=Streptomyces sp. NBC_00989 TaxID=2903705 RepID=UPI003866A830|nr:hypothetical protein OG714_09350 [Streptomyces sp. NBC_00989]
MPVLVSMPTPTRGPAGSARARVAVPLPRAQDSVLVAPGGIRATVTVTAVHELN